MIICNNCGSTIERGMQFCAECGASITATLPPPTMSANPGIGTTTRPMYPDYGQTLPPTQQTLPPTQPTLPPTQIMNSAPPMVDPTINARLAAPPQSRAKVLIVLISVVAAIAIAIAIYFALDSSPTAKLASAMKTAVSNNQLVTLSGNDAFAYYMQLRSVDPTHKALKEVGQQVLPQLKSMGEEVFRKKTTVTADKDTLQDWLKTQNVYEWAHAIEPTDKQIDARWRFAQGEVAKQQSRKDDAERSFQSAAQLNGSWALPPNSLGLLRSENKRYGEAISYFQKAIDLQINWEIPYNNMGTAYYYLNDYDTAEGWYKQALEKNPNWARPHFWLGSIYEKRGWKPQAIEEYRTALNMSRDNLPLDPFEIQRRIDKLSR